MQPERITFPTEYPIKVVARASEDLRAQLDAIFSQHFGDFAADRVSERPSARSNFVAMTYVMRVEHEGQLGALHLDLKAHSAVVMVL